MPTPPSPKPGDKVTFSHPKVLKGKELQGTLEYDAFEGVTVFMPALVHHTALYDAFFEPETGLFLEGATVTLVTE